VFSGETLTGGKEDYSEWKCEDMYRLCIGFRTEIDLGLDI